LGMKNFDKAHLVYGKTASLNNKSSGKIIIQLKMNFVAYDN